MHKRILFGVLALIILMSLIFPVVVSASSNTEIPNADKIVAYTIRGEPIYERTFYSVSSDFASLSNDGYLIYSGSVYTDVNLAASSIAPASDSGLNSVIGQVGSVDYYSDSRSFLFFDTSTLSAGITISSANIQLYGVYDYSTTDFNIQVQTGGATYPHTAILPTDYDKAHYSGNGGTLSTVGYSVAGYNILNLSSDGKSWINEGGITKFVLLSDRDIAGTTPTGSEYVSFYTYEKGASYRPKLVVNYTYSNPSIEAVDASDIGVLSARLNSHIISDGGDIGNCTVKFGYGTTSQTVANFNSYDTVTDVAGTYSTGGNPSLDISGLNGGITYYFRAQVTNSVGTVTSTNELTFTTESGVDDVTSFMGSPSKTTIALKWSMPSGANEVEIYRSGLPYTDPSQNLLTNPSFESGDPPDDWTLYGAGATVAQSTTQVKYGSYSGALTRSGADCGIYQAFTSSAVTYTVGSWVWASAANAARIIVTDNAGNTFNSSYHTGNSNWQFLSVSGLLTAVANASVNAVVNNSNTTAYFDDVYLIVGSSINHTGGIEAYSGSSTTYSDTGMTSGRTYYYQIYALSGTLYSVNPKTLAVTTLGADNSVSGGDALPTPALPNDFFSNTQTGAGSPISNIEPLYTLLGNAANSLGMPTDTIIVIIALIVVGALGVLVLLGAHSVSGALFIMCIAMTVEVAMQLIPWQFIALIIPMALGTWATSRGEGSFV